MSSRREFLKLTAAATSGVVAIAGMAWADQTEDGPFQPSPLSRVIVDDRFEFCTAFGKRQSQSGVPLSTIHGDITALWYDDLYFAWRRDALPLVGLTTAESLFCLEVLARDAGWKVTSRKTFANGLVLWAIGRRGTEPVALQGLV